MSIVDLRCFMGLQLFNCKLLCLLWICIVSFIVPFRIDWFGDEDKIWIWPITTRVSRKVGTVQPQGFIDDSNQQRNWYQSKFRKFAS